MTIYKPIYNPNYDPRNPVIEVGIEIQSKAQIETDCHRLVPVMTKVIFGKINRSDYSTETLHKLMREHNYSPNAFVIKSVWECQEGPEI